MGQFESDSADSPNGMPAREFRFSPAAEELIRRAKILAKKSGRAGITSSCLLFAFVESAGAREDAAQFFHAAVRQTKQYHNEFDRFLREEDDNKGRGTHDGGPALGKVSRNTLDLVMRAEEFAQQTSDLPVIHLRHLLAALLADTKEKLPAANRLERMGLELPALRKQFRRFIHQRENLGEDPQAWDAILGPLDPPPASSPPPLRKAAQPLREFLLSADFGAAMDAGDRRAFRIGVVLAQRKSGPMRSVHVLQGYLLAWSHDDGSAEAALAVMVWFCLRGGRQEEVSRPEVDFWPVLGLESERAWVLEAIKNPQAGDEWAVSEELATLALRSLRLAQATRPGEPVCTRHLLACLIGQTGKEIDPTALQEFDRLGIDINELRAMYRDWWASERKGDVVQPLDEALGVTAEQAKGRWNAGFRPWPANPSVPDAPRPGPLTAGAPGYASEFCGVGGSEAVPDHLNVDALAQRLAELIASRDTKLPLAVGLFGNWGSGKSHFMNLMDRGIKRLAQETPEDWARRVKGQGDSLPPGLISEEGPWHREIVPVYFNAWHYVDTNLWASLAAQIFDSLFAYLRPEKSKLEALQTLLEQAPGVAARAAEELLIAQEAVKKAHEELQEAEAKRLAGQSEIDALFKGLGRLLPNMTSAELKQEAVGLLGVQKELDTLEDLHGVLQEAQAFAGRARITWGKVLEPQGRPWRIVYLLGALVVAPALAYVASGLLPYAKEWLGSLGQAMAGLAAGVAAFLPWLRPILAEVDSQLKKLEDAVGEAEGAQQKMLDSGEYKEARMNLDAAKASEQGAMKRLEEARAREGQLREQAQVLMPERRLGRFIEQRAQSSDYRGQLGLVSLVRRDFQELSDIFTDVEAWKKKCAEPFGKAAGAKPDEAKIKLGEQLSRSIDRIVLFVDDLDRCQPEKVVDVLQAVHLLLAFPLFAVVVGVDQRCLRQSLRMQFKGLLAPEAGQKNGQAMARGVDNDERPATPLDYLEKIFHIPFHLPPMGQEGFGKLIEALSKPPAHQPEQEEKAVPLKPPETEAKVERPENRRISPEPAATTDESKPAVETSQHVSSAGKEDEGDAPHPDTPKPVRVVGSVPLEEWERTALKDYHWLIHTPRGATRLLNTYRLVRAGIPAEQWAAFRGDEPGGGESCLAMLLLASAAGHPAVAREWFKALRDSADPASLNEPAAAEEKDSEAKAWEQFKRVYERDIQKMETPLTKKLLDKWLDQVERFAF